MLKRDLRLSHQKLRSSISHDDRLLKSRAIARNCRSLPIWDASLFHIFLSIPERGEVDTSFLIDHIRKNKGRIAVPKIRAGRQMTHHVLESGTKLQPNSLNIPEPVDAPEVNATQIDVVFLPLLAWDTRGYRVGYGGGYYDRFLHACRADVVRVGLSFFPAVDAIEDLHATDVPMDYCVTPREVVSF